VMAIFIHAEDLYASAHAGHSRVDRMFSHIRKILLIFPKPGKWHEIQNITREREKVRISVSLAIEYC